MKDIFYLDGILWKQLVPTTSSSVTVYILANRVLFSLPTRHRKTSSLSSLFEVICKTQWGFNPTIGIFTKTLNSITRPSTDPQGTPLVTSWEFGFKVLTLYHPLILAGEPLFRICMSRLYLTSLFTGMLGKNMSNALLKSK